MSQAYTTPNTMMDGIPINKFSTSEAGDSKAKKLVAVLEDTSEISRVMCSGSHSNVTVWLDDSDNAGFSAPDGWYIESAFSPKDSTGTAIRVRKDS